jgi:hypothetical protein
MMLPVYPVWAGLLTECMLRYLSLVDPRLLEKRGIDESRHGSRARHRHRGGFFL